MFKVIGKIYIFLSSLLLVIFGISMFLIYAISYLNPININELILMLFTFLIAFLEGLIGILIIRFKKPCITLLIINVLLFICGILYICLLCYGFTSNYNYTACIVTMILSLLTFLAIYWNRGSLIYEE